MHKSFIPLFNKKVIEQTVTIQKISTAHFKTLHEPKLIWVDISKSNRLSFDSKSFHLADTCFFLPSSDAFVFGLLNSSIQEYIFKALKPISRGSFYQYKIQYVETLQLSNIDE